MDFDALIAAARRRLHERINRIVGQKLRRQREEDERRAARGKPATKEAQ
jgi:hypothetical protein